jgi:hypothetical protein
LLAVIKIARFIVVQQGLELLGADLVDLQGSSKETDNNNNSVYKSSPSASLHYCLKGCLQLVQQIID